jgi:hypothetical protein
MIVSSRVAAAPYCWCPISRYQSVFGRRRRRGASVAVAVASQLPTSKSKVGSSSRERKPNGGGGGDGRRAQRRGVEGRAAVASCRGSARPCARERLTSLMGEPPPDRRRLYQVWKGSNVCKPIIGFPSSFR